MNEFEMFLIGYGLKNRILMIMDENKNVAQKYECLMQFTQNLTISRINNNLYNSVNYVIPVFSFLILNE